MTSWPALKAEIDRWADEGHTATFWWRDDDATHATPELDRLLRISKDAAAPIALAVIPATADKGLAARLASEDGVDVLQHGYAHRNHEPEDRPKSELGPSRDPAQAMGELTEGWSRLNDLFGGKALPVLVPPWNRMDAALREKLPGVGLRGVSAFKPRSEPATPEGLIRVNTHVDIIDWRGNRGFVGEAPALAATLDHLERRREGTVDPAEPTGILSHHLDHDDGCTAFLGRLAALVSDHPAAAWISARELFDA